MKYIYEISNSKLFSFSFQPIDAMMYILLSGEHALIIDPCIDNNALNLLRKGNVKDIIILPTHEHYDHISGINWLREHFSCKVIAIEECVENMANPKKNFSANFEALFLFHPEEIQNEIKELNIKPYICYADEVFKDHLSFIWQEHSVELVKTPGHSQGSVCIIIDNRHVFTGDSFIFGLPTITRLPGGSKKDFQNITQPFLDSLPKDTIIFPGHGNNN